MRSPSEPHVRVACEPPICNATKTSLCLSLSPTICCREILTLTPEDTQSRRQNSKEEEEEEHKERKKNNSWEEHHINQINWKLSLYVAIGLVAAFASPSPTFIGKNTQNPFSSLPHEKPISSHSLKVEIRIHCIVLRTQRGEKLPSIYEKKETLLHNHAINQEIMFFLLYVWMGYLFSWLGNGNQFFSLQWEKNHPFFCVKMAFVLVFWLRQSTQFHLLLLCNWANDKLVF